MGGGLHARGTYMGFRPAIGTLFILMPAAVALGLAAGMIAGGRMWHSAAVTVGSIATMIVAEVGAGWVQWRQSRSRSRNSNPYPYGLLEGGELLFLMVCGLAGVVFGGLIVDWTSTLNPLVGALAGGAACWISRIAWIVMRSTPAGSKTS